MSDLPRISIVTPSYNQAQFLERTIISVLNQNYPDPEYMIIDGGSTDGSVDIIRKYEKHLSYWISEPDKGQSDALCKGFSRATGQILAWLNSDDTYLPGALFRVADTFKRHPDAAIVYGDYMKVDAGDRCIGLKRQPSFDYKVFMHAYNMAIQPASFFQRKAFFEVGGIDASLRYTMDYDLMLRLAQYGRAIHIGEYLATYRLHSTSKTMAEGSRFPAESRRVILKYFGRKPAPGEIFFLHWYHTARIFLRMLREGCLASRFGRDTGDYELNGVYTPAPYVAIDGS